MFSLPFVQLSAHDFLIHVLFLIILIFVIMFRTRLNFHILFSHPLLTQRSLPSVISPFLVTRFSTIPPKDPKQPIPIVLNESDLEEKYVKGSGPGGQAINKRNTMVQLFHKPTGIRVQTQLTRSLVENRKHARTLLKERLDEMINGELSKAATRIKRLQKLKANRERKAKKKYGKKLENTEDEINIEDEVNTDGMDQDKSTKS